MFRIKPACCGASGWNVLTRAGGARHERRREATDASQVLCSIWRSPWSAVAMPSSSSSSAAGIEFARVMAGAHNPSSTMRLTALLRAAGPGFYELLGVSRGVAAKELRKVWLPGCDRIGNCALAIERFRLPSIVLTALQAYLTKCKEVHPDQLAGRGAAEVARATQAGTPLAPRGLA